MILRLFDLLLAKLPEVQGKDYFIVKKSLHNILFPFLLNNKFGEDK